MVFIFICVGFSELLTQDAISVIFLNPSIWIYSAYEVQRELYLFLIQQFDNDPRLLKNLCRIPLILDIICKFYCDNAKFKFAPGSKTPLHSSIEVLGERPTKDEIRKIRLLLLSLGEMSIRYSTLLQESCLVLLKVLHQVLFILSMIRSHGRLCNLFIHHYYCPLQAKYCSN